MNIIASKEYSDNFKTEAAVVLCSLAHGSIDTVSNLVDSGAVSQLMACLSSQNIKLVEAAYRALRTIFQNSSASPQSIDDQSIYLLISHLSPTDISKASFRVSELAAAIIAKLALFPEYQTRLAEAGALFPLISLLESSQSARLQESALDAIASLSFNNFHIVSTFMAIKSTRHSKFKIIGPSGHDPVSLILHLVRSETPSIKLYACSCLVYMYRSKGLPDVFYSSMSLTVLPTLIKLFNETEDVFLSTIQEKAIRLFSILVADDELLQKAAMEGDAISQLSDILNRGPSISVEMKEASLNDYHIRTNSWNQTEESILLALGSVTSLLEENRRHVLVIV